LPKVLLKVDLVTTQIEQCCCFYE